MSLINICRSDVVPISVLPLTTLKRSGERKLSNGRVLKDGKLLCSPLNKYSDLNLKLSCNG